MALLRAGSLPVSQETLLYRHGSGACVPLRSVLAAAPQLAQAAHACLVANLAFRDASRRHRRRLAEVLCPGQPCRAWRPEGIYPTKGRQWGPAGRVVLVQGAGVAPQAGACS